MSCSSSDSTHSTHGSSSWRLSPQALEIPLSLYEKNRKRLVEELRKELARRSEGEKTTAVVVLRGGNDVPLYDSDVDFLFRQESYFQWCFGVREPGFFGAIDVESGESTLFAPHLDESYAVWMGVLPTPETIKASYQVEHCLEYDPEDAELAAVAAWLAAKQSQAASGQRQLVILTLSGINSDSKKPAIEFDERVCPQLSQFKVDRQLLYPIISDLRAIKTAEEIEVMRHVCKVSSEAHNHLLQRTRTGMTEYQLESLFLHYVYAVGGCRHVGYTCISCSGPNAAILHYGHAGAPNDRTLKEGDIMMLDMGGEYAGYTADISCSWPANGHFTPLQRAVYEAVAAAQHAVIAAMKPGVSWLDMHLLAESVLLRHLQQPPLQLIAAEADLQQAQRDRLCPIFMPHGLGHLLGLDVHEVGGYLPHHPPRSTEPGLRSLRTARLLEPGMILTVEPGLYFIDCLLDRALADPVHSKYLVKENVDKLRGFGGIRLEDDVLVTADGSENLTLCPRTPDEVEALMAQGRLLFPEPFTDIKSQFFSK